MSKQGYVVLDWNHCYKASTGSGHQELIDCYKIFFKWLFIIRGAFRLTSRFYYGFVYLGISLALCVMLVFVLWFPPHFACVSVLPIFFYCAFFFLQHIFTIDHDYRQSFSTNNTTGSTSWIVTAFPSGAPDINPWFSGVRDVQSEAFCVHSVLLTTVGLFVSFRFVLFLFYNCIVCVPYL